MGTGKEWKSETTFNAKKEASSKGDCEEKDLEPEGEVNYEYHGRTDLLTLSQTPCPRNFTVAYGALAFLFFTFRVKVFPTT